MGSDRCSKYVKLWMMDVCAPFYMLVAALANRVERISPCAWP